MNGVDEEFTSPVFSMETLMRSIANPYGKKVIVNGVPADKTGLEENKDSKEEKTNGIFGAIFIISFIGAIIAMVVFSQTEPLLCLATFGALLFVIGLAILFQHGLSLDNMPSLALPLLGAVLTAIPAINVYHRSHPDSFYFTMDMIIDVICIGFALVGVGLIVIPPLIRSRKMRKCSQIISAMCVYRTTRSAQSKEANGRTRHYDLYAPWWQYEVNDVIYVTCEDTYTNEKVPDIGEIQEIRISPDEPSEIYRPLIVSRLVPLFIGVMFVVISSFTLFVLH